MMQSSSSGTASETWAQTGSTRTGLQPDGDGSCRASCGFELAFRLINDLVLGASVRLGRFAKHFRLKGFNIMKAVPDLSAKFEKYWSARFSPPALQSRLTEPPPLSQLGLGHASFGLHVRHSAGVFRTAIKALFAGKAKWDASWSEGKWHKTVVSVLKV
jgi:hypothetical protein